MRILSRAALVFGLLVGLIAPAPLASAAPVPAPGVHKRTVTMDNGWQREYLLKVPAGRPAAKPRPLVVALHGGLNDMNYLRETSGLDGVADRNGFLVAYPNGFLGSWNAGGCCFLARLAGIDDVGFLDRLIASLVRSGQADPRRIYLTGFSNGGGMAYRYACERSGTVAAVGVVSGSLATPCKPAKPISVIAFHGTADFSVPYQGGGNLDWDNKNPFPSVAQVMDFWLGVNLLKPLRDIVLDARDTLCRASPPARTTVTLCTITDGGHEWPRGTGKGVDASPVIWDFFARHPKA
ncbi:alpha/beta hydrolase family esterase [Actinomadura hibisca]|uniref:alpha/beta hydrolase family esterase n=1 Tax=Actinomadura hibisca TaxID=68565 RepID=UPI00082AF6E6|nr:PHB depolymerase family esterase [Actinomadura hibisca]